MSSVLHFVRNSSFCVVRISLRRICICDAFRCCVFVCVFAVHVSCRPNFTFMCVSSASPSVLHFLYMFAVFAFRPHSISSVLHVVRMSLFCVLVLSFVSAFRLNLSSPGSILSAVRRCCFASVHICFVRGSFCPHFAVCVVGCRPCARCLCAFRPRVVCMPPRISQHPPVDPKK